MITRNGHVKELTNVSYRVLLTLIDVFKTFFSKKVGNFFFFHYGKFLHTKYLFVIISKSLLTNAVILD